MQKVALAHPFESPKTWNDPEIVNLLQTSEILETKDMRTVLVDQGKEADFTTDVLLVSLKDGIQGVFKGVPLEELFKAQAEVCAYQASIKLKFPYVPPTVLRKINGITGSLQLYVKTDIDLLEQSQREQVLQEVSREDKENLKLFHFIFGQWDSGPENLLAYRDEGGTYLIAIDNTNIYQRQRVKYGEPPFVEIARSEDLLEDDLNPKEIESVTPEKLKMVFPNKFKEQFYNRFNKGSFRYITYQNSLWRQYNVFDENFKSYTEVCSLGTFNTLQNLNLEILQEIFTLDYFTQEYCHDILERRDQVLGR